MSVYQVKEFSHITRAVVSPATAAMLSTVLPSPERLAVLMSVATPEQRETIPREIAELRLAALAYRAQRPAFVPVYVAPDLWIKAAAAADDLGCTGRTVVNRIKAGKLVGRQVGKLWFVDRDSVNDFKVSKTHD